MARQVMGCMTAGKEDSWDGARAEAAVFIAQLGAGVTAGLHHARAGFWALDCQVAGVIWMAQPVPCNKELPLLFTQSS